MTSFKELEESQAWKEYLAFEEEKRKSIKSGDDVMHLDYFSGMLTEEELSNFEEELSKIGLRLGSYDKSGQMTASLDDLSLVTFLVLSNTTVKAIIDGTLTNLTWETIKHITLRVYRKVRGQTITKFTTGTSEQKPATFSINAQLDENTAYSFKLEGRDETVLKGLDKILDFLKEQKPNLHYKFPHLTNYDEKSGRWQALDMEKEIRKIAKKARKSSQK
ncbi:hypothetical protein F9K33_07870 [bacterium]|nr:MAG: hypothetical protein F9K33_07870 [bacterium]